MGEDQDRDTAVFLDIVFIDPPFYQKAKLVTGSSWPDPAGADTLRDVGFRKLALISGTTIVGAMLA
jgi:hypothetical protein